MRYKFRLVFALILFTGCKSASHGASPDMHAPGTDGGQDEGDLGGPSGRGDMALRGFDGGPVPDGGSNSPPPVTCPHEPATLVDTSTPKTVVGSGTPASCTEAALDSALSGGGIVTFNCGAAPFTFQLTTQKTLTIDTVVDGNNLITLSGQGQHRIAYVGTSSGFEMLTPKVTFQRLTFTRGNGAAGATKETYVPANVGGGYSNDAGGGAIYHTGGTVAVIECTFTNNVGAAPGPDVAGGAIYGLGNGPTIVVRTTFDGNQASNGGAIGVLFSPLSIYNSTLTNNSAIGTGANYIGHSGVSCKTASDCTSLGTSKGKTYQCNSPTVSDCFTTCKSDADCDASAGYYYDCACAKNSSGVCNDQSGSYMCERELGKGGNGGAVSIDGGGGTVDVCGVVANGNKGNAFGGAFFRTLDTAAAPSLKASFVDCSFDGNTITDSGTGGGALYMHSTVLEVSGTTISNNSSPGGGGGMWIEASPITFSNNTFFGNVARNGIGGAIFVNYGETGDIINNTFVANEAESPTGYVWAGAIGGVGTTALTLSNSLLAGNLKVLAMPSGDGVACQPTLTGNGPSLQFASDPSHPCSTDLVTAFDPMATTLADNGGPTKTVLPAASATMLNVGLKSLCPSTDQRGRQRSNASACTVGALELP